MARYKTILLLASIFGIISSRKTSMYFEKFTNCPEYKNYTSKLQNCNIRIEGDTMYVNYETNVLKDSRGLLEFVWEIQRCSSKEKLDTCIMFHKLRTNKYCAMLDSEGQAWSPFMSCVHPKLTCPLKKGIYGGKNCTIDAAAFKFFPLQGAYWRFRAKVFERKTIMRMCIDVFGYLKEYY